MHSLESCGATDTAAYSAAFETESNRIGSGFIKRTSAAAESGTVARADAAASSDVTDTEANRIGLGFFKRTGSAAESGTCAGADSAASSDVVDTDASRIGLGFFKVHCPEVDRQGGDLLGFEILKIQRQRLHDK